MAASDGRGTTKRQPPLRTALGAVRVDGSEHREQEENGADELNGELRSRGGQQRK